MSRRYIDSCPACREMRECGLEFEETHSTRKPGYIETDTGYIKSPHSTVSGRIDYDDTFLDDTKYSEYIVALQNYLELRPNDRAARSTLGKLGYALIAGRSANFNISDTNAILEAISSNPS